MQRRMTVLVGRCRRAHGTYFVEDVHREYTKHLQSEEEVRGQRRRSNRRRQRPDLARFCDEDSSHLHGNTDY